MQKSEPVMSRSVGSRIRLRRKMLRITQEELGDWQDIAYQKFQKYEKGTNKISACQ